MKKQIKKMISVLMSVSMLSSIALMTTANAKTREIFTPVTTEDFNDQAQELSLVAPWLTPTYVEETTGSGNYAWHVGFPYNADGLYAQTGNVISSEADKYYIEFDFKTDPCNNMTFTPANSSNGTPGISISTSYQGYMVSTGLTPAAKGLANDASVLNNNVATVEANKNGWMQSSSPISYSANEWHKAKFLYDKTANTIGAYVDGTLIRTKTLSSGNAADYTKLLFYSHNNALAKGTHFYIDNFVIGTVTEEQILDVSVTNATLDSATGTVSVTFDDDVDEATLNEDTVAIFDSEDYAVGYSNASYNSVSKTWSAIIDDYNKYSGYTLLISGATGIYGNTVNEYTKTFEGEERIEYIPVTTEDFNDQAHELGLNAPWLNPNFKEDIEGNGNYTWHVGFPYDANGLNAATGNVISSTEDKYYVEFDFKTDPCNNMSLTPATSASNTAGITISTSYQGYMISALYTANNKGLNGDASVLNNSAAVVEANKDGWMRSTSPIPYQANEWHKAKFVYDKTANSISSYIDDTLCKTKTLTSGNVADYTKLLFFSHDTASGKSTHFYIDNFTIGYVGEIVLENSVKLIDSDNNVIEGTVTEDMPVYVKADILNDTASSKNYTVYIACYDVDGTCIDVKALEKSNIAAGESATVRGTTLGYSTLAQGTKKVKAFLWTDNNAPVVENDEISVQAAE